MSKKNININKSKGFTIVELVVSFSLMMVVIIYLLRTIIVISNKENELLTLQEYTIVETNLLKHIYTDINESESPSEISIVEDNNKILIDGVGNYIEFDTENNYIIYGNIIYELPEGVKIDKNPYSIENFTDTTMVSDNNVFYIAKINLSVNGESKSIKIVHQYYDDNSSIIDTTASTDNIN